MVRWLPSGWVIVVDSPATVRGPAATAGLAAAGAAMGSLDATGGAGAAARGPA